MNVSNAVNAENIDPAMSAEKQAPGTPSRIEIEAAEAETPPPAMTTGFLAFAMSPAASCNAAAWPAERT